MVIESNPCLQTCSLPDRRLEFAEYANAPVVVIAQIRGRKPIASDLCANGDTPVVRAVMFEARGAGSRVRAMRILSESRSRNVPAEMVAVGADEAVDAR